ncbi:MAG: hypothetical protein ABJD11_02815 [Gemmatimonadota bacterium]
MGLHLLTLNLALYIGPDQLMPLTSIIGAIGGALMIFWRQVAGAFRKFVGLFSKK